MAFPLIALSGLLRSPAAKKVGRFIGTNARALLARARRQPAATGPVLSGISPGGPMNADLPLETLLQKTNLNNEKTRGGAVRVESTEKTRGGAVPGPGFNVPNPVYGVEPTETTQKGFLNNPVALYVALGLVVYMALKQK